MSPPGRNRTSMLTGFVDIGQGREWKKPILASRCLQKNARPLLIAFTRLHERVKTLIYLSASDVLFIYFFVVAKCRTCRSVFVLWIDRANELKRLALFHYLPLLSYGGFFRPRNPRRSDDGDFRLEHFPLKRHITQNSNVMGHTTGSHWLPLRALAPNHLIIKHFPA